MSIAHLKPGQSAITRTTGCGDRRASIRRRSIASIALLAALFALPSSALLAQEAEDEVESEPPKIVEGIEKFKEAVAGVSGVEISGFFDMQATPRGLDPDEFSMGDFEVDFARDLGSNVQLAAALVANDEGANLAVGFIDVHFLGHMIAPRGRLPVEKGVHLQLGRFDVPFGQDWQYYAAKDRTELSAPLTTESLMDGGLNDSGVRILGGSSAFNYSAFVIRADGPGSLYGGRVGITPLDNPYRFEPRAHLFEAGLSVLQDIDGDGHTRGRFLALDSDAQLGSWHLRGEYVRSDPADAETRAGWHFTAAYDASAITRIPVIPYARYDTVDEMPADFASIDVPSVGALRTERLTAGVNATLLRFLLLKLEYQRILATPFDLQSDEGFRRDSWFGQAVIVF